MNKKIEKYILSLNSKKAVLYGPLLKKLPEIHKESLHFLIDGGATFQDLIPGSISLGDGDSHSGHLDILLPKEKDLSDLGYALNQLHEMRELYFYGFIGKRLDHQLAVFGETFHFLKKGNSQVCFFDNHVFATNRKEVNLNILDTFSIFSIEEMKLSISGQAKYKLINQRISPFSSHTLSNIGNGTIHIQADKPFFIFYECNSNKSHDMLLPLHKE